MLLFQDVVEFSSKFPTIFSRSIPSFSVHPMYMKVMRAICPLWAELIDKNASILARLQTSDPSADEPPKDTGVPQPRGFDEGVKPGGRDHRESQPAAKEHTAEARPEPTPPKGEEPERDEKNAKQKTSKNDESIDVTAFANGTVAYLDFHTAWISQLRGSPDKSRIPDECSELARALVNGESSSYLPDV